MTKLGRNVAFFLCAVFYLEMDITVEKFNRQCHTDINNNECIGYVQKRMGSRLRERKKKSLCTTVDDKGKKKRSSLGGNGKLIAKTISKLTVHYGLAIRRNCDPVKKMHDAIWATFNHYSSTSNNPNHSKCPIGAGSWCYCQRASANNKLVFFYTITSPCHKMF